jgi:hypothetical protein
VSSPAAREVARKQAVAKTEITDDIIGTESENIFQSINKQTPKKIQGNHLQDIYIAQQ